MLNRNYHDPLCEYHDKMVDGADSIFQELVDLGESHWFDKDGNCHDVTLAQVEQEYADEIDDGMKIVDVIRSYVEWVIEQVN